MDVLHITQTKNIPSIMKNGIRRGKPLLDQFNDVMEYEYGEDYDKDKGLVFGMPENINRRDKYIKDFFYWKTWGNERNKMLAGASYNQYSDYKEQGPKVFSHIKIEPTQFSILLINIPFMQEYDYYVHGQFGGMSVLWKDMDVRYEHKNKPLTLINYDVDVSRIKKVIATGESMVTRKNKINVSLNI